MSASAGIWTSATRGKIREIQDGLLAMASWARESHATEIMSEQLLEPYRVMLESLYERDMPLAKLADSSDLLLHVHGPAASGPSPRVSVVSRLLTQTRDQVTRLAKQFAGVTTVRVPPSLDMGFVGVASGSLFVGFSADSTGEGDLTRRAVQAISLASEYVSDNRPVAELARALPDPAARDMAITAVRHLSPSGLIGISEIDLLGNQVERSTSLTTETRRHARGLMAQRVVVTETPIAFVGTVREVDLDAFRFEIRNVEGHPGDIRCAHELPEDVVKPLVGHRVRVKGTAELGETGVVRLLWVDEVEDLDWDWRQ